MKPHRFKIASVFQKAVRNKKKKRLKIRLGYIGLKYSLIKLIIKAELKLSFSTHGKQRLQDLKPKKKDKQRRIRERQYKIDNAGVPDWL